MSRKYPPWGVHVCNHFSISRVLVVWLRKKERLLIIYQSATNNSSMPFVFTFSPGVPSTPASPTSPVGPREPLSPFGPGSPWVPFVPGLPLSPLGPFPPGGHCGHRSFSPFCPWTPDWPGGPCAPGSPWRPGAPLFGATVEVGHTPSGQFATLAEDHEMKEKHEEECYRINLF